MSGELGGSMGLERARAPLASKVVWATVACLLVLLAWAAAFELDEVTTGTGRVVPTSREQVVQSLEGGILARLLVREGDVVEPGQVLAHLDPTLAEATVEESASRMRATLAKAARLQAEVGGGALEFPAEVSQDPLLVRAETALYQSRRDSLQETTAGLGRALSLINQEISLTTPLVERGAASNVELLRLRRQANELQNKLADLRSQYLVTAREELATANAQVLEYQSVTRGRSDALRRSTIVSPVKGIVKNVEVTTVGGVIPPTEN